MQVLVNADSDPMQKRVRQVLDYYLPALDDHADRLEVGVTAVRDALDRPLYRCHVTARPLRGRSLEVEETQADLVLSVTRALDRTLRTLRRQKAVRQLARSA
jgi:ribosome-associated translation inhibitor RaiA